MKIAILGYGSQGRAAYEYWNTPENHITICDANEKLDAPEDTETRLGKSHLANLHEFDMIVRTPVLHPSQIARANPDHPDVITKVTSVTNEFLKVCPTRNIIGVTGTKGKGTTSTLIAKILESTGYRVHLGGNIGIPPLDLLKNDIKPEDWVVLELANFQLIDIKHSPHIAVCLMVEPEHLDWHSDMDEYVAAKQKLFVHQKSDDIAIFYKENQHSTRVTSVSTGIRLPYMHHPGAIIQNNDVVIHDVKVCSVNDIALVGKHNLQNVCAAVTAIWQVTQDVHAIRRAISEFSGLPYRIEHRGTKHNVHYYNDSFATASGATTAAIEAIPEPKVMIIGGYDRGLDLTNLTQSIIHNHSTIRKVVLIGASADRVAETFMKYGFENYIHERSQDMHRIVQVASVEAQPHDAVVLSPAFASFDMFKNFEERGKAFNSAVSKL